MRLITDKELKIMAGELFLEEFGREFLIENRNRIGTGIIDYDDVVCVDFEIFEKDIGEYGDHVHMKGEEEHFPEIVFSVYINKKTGEMKSIINEL